MKNIIKLSIPLTFLVSLFFACSFKPFNKIQIKVQPTLEAPLGVREFSANSYLSKEKIQKILTDKTKDEKTKANTIKRIAVYDYIPKSEQDPNRKKQLRYLIHYSITDIDLNFDNYADVIGDTLSAEMEEQQISFVTPKIETSQTVHIPFSDINTGLLNAIGKGKNSLSIPRVSKSSLTQVPANLLDIGFKGFQKLEFGENSSLIITVTRGIPSQDFYAVEEATLMNGSETVARWNGTAPTDPIRFNLSNKSLSPSAIITFMVKSNKDADDVPIQIGYQLEGKIKKAEGITIDPIQIDIPGISFPLDIDKKFQSAKIAVGEAKMQAILPAAWKGIIPNIKRSIQQTDGLYFRDPGFTPSNTALSLTNQTVNKNPINVSATMQIVFNNATITETEPIPLQTEIKIEKFDSVSFKPEHNLEYKYKQKFSQDVQKWLTAIEFNKVIAEIEIQNGLPQGSGSENTIKTTAKSKAFNIPETTEEFPADKTTTKKIEGGKNLKIKFGRNPDIDFTVKIFPPGYDEVNKTITVYNISSGQELSFKGKVKIIFDWKTLTVDSGQTVKDSYPEDSTYIDLSEVSAILKKSHLKIHEIPAYFYIGSPALKDKKVKPKVKIWANTTNSTGEKQKIIMASNNDPATADYVEKEVKEKSLPIPLADEKIPYTGEIPENAVKLKKEKDNNAWATFMDIINEYPESLKIYYEFDLGEIILNKEDIKLLLDKDRNTKLQADILIDVPVGFEVTEDSTLSFADIMDEKRTDIFGREQGSTSSTVDTISQYLHSVLLCAKVENTTGLASAFTLQAFDKDKKPIFDPKELMVGQASNEAQILFTGQELQKIKDTIPFIPEIVMKIPKGNYYIERDAKLKANLSIIANTDIDYTYDMTGSKEH
ncbi:hypothetical protein [Treponema phagedenis]|uniref:hypothetical protein n=1 Tax=Treponema phagedenis TaxID=162 RepID=UPI001582AC98|nr:hypothetical protein [Treponema phagedenis]NVP24952.1 hypothetical protein [Treponema phagedenis]QKS91742.1 hypothetical protein HPJ96_03605 [Treponema phagedenis]QLC59338.1 hypothetical protein HW453_11425 [Treponema phagedenis]